MRIGKGAIRIPSSICESTPITYQGTYSGLKTDILNAEELLISKIYPETFEDPEKKIRIFKVDFMNFPPTRRRH
jgi:hypothetical protein